MQDEGDLGLFLSEVYDLRRSLPDTPTVKACD